MKPLQYTLMPRWKGLSTILSSIHDQFSRKGRTTTIKDLTVAFTGRGWDSALPLTRKDRKLPTPFDLLTGNGPTGFPHSLSSLDCCL